jgi:hypothetical protein
MAEMSGSAPAGVWWHVPDERLAPAIGGIVGALAAVPDGPTPLQWTMLEAVVRHVFGSDLDPRNVPVLDPAQLADALLTGRARLLAVHLMVTLEFVRHPEPLGLAESVARYADALDVDEPMVSAARHFADDQALLLYLDIQRNAEFTEQTWRGARAGRWWRLLRNKLAYQGLVADPEIAARWRSLDACPEGSWGRAVAEFYHRHGFPYPGERDGISEVGARHDFVHVLAEYPPTPEGEIDVFALIAAAMPDPKGFTQFAMTLGLFQNGAIRHVAGKRIRIARTDTLADPGAPARWADAMRRGAACTADVLNVDHFAMKALPLDEARERLGIVPKGVPGPDEAPRKRVHHPGGGSGHALQPDPG